ncbi:MAG: Phytanoyl-CoA dioxygenase, peroxisomal precursor [uncultured Thermomicrobiales bacterium]|uniref:Phytanoyl-CoA dioxygenase, peroxisomal n=1 Tax=uncultured Thermomicrobiales bacterium TaxID=1645740 RepID=A0A6J4V0G3_9BACT|nr:MAG: Phytanoyl-CoA dioxygenase, peroxisomal precursor [uncultured Thermomicrobiales bacterium]
MVAVATPARVDVNVDALPAHEPYRVSVAEYVAFRQQGFLVVPQLVSPEDVDELRRHTEDLMQGQLPEQRAAKLAERDTHGDSGVSMQELAAPPEHLSPEAKAEYFLRIHMLHRKLALHERYLLHPRVLDVLEALIGPDVLALQSMLFLKPPGKPGQGWHQDSYYIPTHPDSLCGAWIAIDDCDELNGAMWMATGSQHEPVYPPKQGYGHGDRTLADATAVGGVSDPDDAHNDLARIADRYPQLLVPARAGDVVFFGGHVLHRSKKNFSADRFRRSFVGHYCNARSFTQWGADAAVDPATGMTNGSHILARGDTHLPFAQPRFGTPCAATLPPEARRRHGEVASMPMGDMDDGMMGMEPADPDIEHDHGDDEE